MRGQGRSHLIPWYMDMGLCTGQAPGCQDVVFVSQTCPRDSASLGGSGSDPNLLEIQSKGKVMVLLLLRFEGLAALGPALAPLLCRSSCNRCLHLHHLDAGKCFTKMKPFNHVNCDALGFRHMGIAQENVTLVSKRCQGPKL